MLVKLIILFLIGFEWGWAQAQNANVPPPAPPVAQPPAELPKLPEPPPIPPTEPGADLDSEIPANDFERLAPTARDPFAKPKSILEKEIEVSKPIIDPSVYIDTRIEAIRRYPLRNYSLVGIIFDVENPKAMVKDPDNNMHLLTITQRIGNQEGQIVKIERGELVVEEKGKLVTIKLQK